METSPPSKTGLCCHCLSATWARCNKFYKSYYLPLYLVTAIIFGALVPWPGQQLAKTPLKYILVSIIFTLQGLGLNASEIKRALRACTGLVWGFFVILGVTPLLSFAVIHLPFEPNEFSIGLALFCCMPTTISSGVALAKEAGGNGALAIFLTIGTNVLGIFVCPFMLQVYLSTSEEITLDYFDLLWKLLITVLLPFLVGQVVRQLPKIPKIMTKYKEYFGYLSAFCLALIPFMTISKSASSLSEVPAQSFAYIILTACGIHFVYLVFNLTTSYALRMSLEIQKTVVILGSQKTLPVAMSILAFFPESIGEKGLVSVPIIICHVSQIIIDAIIVAQWKKAKGRKPMLIPCRLSGYHDIADTDTRDEGVTAPTAHGDTEVEPPEADHVPGEGGDRHAV